MPDRNSALQHLKDVAGTTPVTFFSLRGRPVTRTWDLEGVTLTVMKRTYSQAEPAHISYEIDLGPVMPDDRMIIYVKYPKDDDVVNGLLANRVAYQRCLDDLIANTASFTSEKAAL